MTTDVLGVLDDSPHAEGVDMYFGKSLGDIFNKSANDAVGERKIIVKK